MAFLAQAFSQKSTTYDIIREMLRGNISSSGKSVTTNNSVEVPTVLACTRVIANGISQVPLKLMQVKDGKRLPAVDHPLYKVLNSRANEWQTSFEFRETIAIHTVLCGNAYSFINRSNRAGIMELIPFEPGSVTVKRDDRFNLTYEVQAENGSKQVFPAKTIWHSKGPSWNSWMGLDAVKLARQSIGLAMATEAQQGAMQKNGVRSSGVYSVEGTLKDDQYASLRNWIDSEMSGPDKAGKVMVLDRNAKWLNTSMTGIDAQTLETRRFQVEEICRAFLVNPIMVFAESKNTTYASAEQQFLSHLIHTIAPWYQRLEQSIDANLLTDKDREEGYYSNFVEEGLLRGSAIDTKDVILGYVNGGIMTADEGRAKLDMNPLGTEESSTLRPPQNIVGKPPEPPVKSAEILYELKMMELNIENARAQASRDKTQDLIFDKLEQNKKEMEFALDHLKQNLASPIAPTSAPSGYVRAGDVYVTLPDGMVKITNEISVPETVVNVAAPNVTIEPAIVNLEATLPTPTIEVSLPARKTETTITRDRNGDIATARQIETDV